MSLEPDLQRKLLKAENFREFLNLALPLTNQSQAILSRRAGFGSRSYLSELLKGKKGLSKDSLSRLKLALRLPRRWSQYFECLAWMEDAKLRPLNWNEEDVLSHWRRLQADLKRDHSDLGRKAAEAHVPRPQVFQVYAALGDLASGATFPEILQRTGLTEKSARQALAQLLEYAAVEKKDDKFFALSSRADALNLRRSEALAEMLGTVCTDLQKNRSKIVSIPTNLTLYSAFSVQKEQLPLLKQKLQEAVFDVLDEFQVDSGNQVQQIFVSLYGNPMEIS